mmetsp:Transcript_23094/g.58896  ORF Transcript_23094/g.58896 Transcript_23094/m.58896 type:complete len:320 (-) Transcript_23094:650-1609(-)
MNETSPVCEFTMQSWPSRIDVRAPPRLLAGLAMGLPSVQRVETTRLHRRHRALPRHQRRLTGDCHRHQGTHVEQARPHRPCGHHRCPSAERPRRKASAAGAPSCPRMEARRPRQHRWPPLVAMAPAGPWLGARGSPAHACHRPVQRRPARRGRLGGWSRALLARADPSREGRACQRAGLRHRSPCDKRGRANGHHGRIQAQSVGPPHPRPCDRLPCSQQSRTEREPGAPAPRRAAWRALATRHASPRARNGRAAGMLVLARPSTSSAPQSRHPRALSPRTAAWAAVAWAVPCALARPSRERCGAAAAALLLGSQDTGGR